MFTKQELEKKLREFCALPGETEWLEFKEANDNFKTHEIGKYFSALSNESNLHDRKFGWLIFGVNDKSKKIVGTTYRENKNRLNSLKNQIGGNITNRISFTEIHELFLSEGRVLMFQIPPAPRGIPVSWKGHFYGREGESLSPLGEKHEIIRRQRKYDWSAELCEKATIKDLDEAAVDVARKKFREGNEKSSFYKEIERWDVPTFLNKARLTIEGKITHTTLLLLGKPEAKRFLFPEARMTYIFIDAQGNKTDYEHFDPPFLLQRDLLLNRIKYKDSKFKRLPSDSLSAIEVHRFDNWSILEALNNCIAHQDYSRESRIIVTETANFELRFFNAGSFYMGTIEEYIFMEDTTPENYRNAFLAEAMENIGMIDTIGSGIRKIFSKQRERYLPLPDYYLGENVELIIHGDGKWNDYASLLHSDETLDLGKVFLLDKQQKGYLIDDNDYRYAIISFLKQKRRAGKKEIDDLLMENFDANLSDAQKKKKVTNLLQSLARDKKIKNISSSTRKPIWTILR